MKSHNRTYTRTKSIEIKETEVVYTLETVDDLTSPEFIEYVRKVNSDGYRYHPNDYDPFRLTEDLEKLIESKMKVDETVYVSLGDEVLVIDNEDVRDNYGSFGVTSLYFSIRPLIKSLDYFKK